jgi:hypothetical protein
VFYRWTVIGPPIRREGTVWYECRCSCGTIKDVRGYTLTGGRSRSCGCLRNETTIRTKTTHGKAKKYDRAPEYQVWAGMKNRCSDPKSDRWMRYGGRGIRVCERWLDSFENFYADMGDRPGPGYQIDRIDNDGNYEPGNCRWVTRLVNANNKESSRMIEFQGKVQSLSSWARQVGLTKGALETRLNAGWSVARALTEPTGALKKNTVFMEHEGRKLPLQDWAKITGIPMATLHNRLRAGWSDGRALTTPTDRARRVDWNGQTRTIGEWAKITGLPRSLLHQRLGPMGWPVQKALTTPVRVQ